MDPLVGILETIPTALLGKNNLGDIVAIAWRFANNPNIVYHGKFRIDFVNVYRDEHILNGWVRYEDTTTHQALIRFEGNGTAEIDIQENYF